MWSGTKDALRVSGSRHHGVMLSYSQHGSDLNCDKTGNERAMAISFCGEKREQNVGKERIIIGVCVNTY